MRSPLRFRALAWTFGMAALVLELPFMVGLLFARTSPCAFVKDVWVSRWPILPGLFCSFGRMESPATTEALCPYGKLTLGTAGALVALCFFLYRVKQRRRTAFVVALAGSSLLALVFYQLLLGVGAM